MGPGAFPQVRCPLLVILANNAARPGPHGHSPNTIQAFSPIQINLALPTLLCAFAPHAQGATLHEVKEILGHSQIALMANLFGHASMVAKREVVSRVDAGDSSAAPSEAIN